MFNRKPGKRITSCTITLVLHKNKSDRIYSLGGGGKGRLQLRGEGGEEFRGACEILLMNFLIILIKKTL